MMTIKGQLQWTDYLQSQLLHMRAGRLVTILLYYALFMVALGAVASIFLVLVGLVQVDVIFPPLLVLGAVLFYRYYFLPRQVKKIFFQQKDLSAPFELEINAEGLKASNEFGSSLRPWSHFIRWKENNELFLLYHSDVMYSIVPKRFLTDPGQIETIRNYLVTNKVSTKRNRSKVSCAIYFILIVAIAAMFYMGFRSQ